MAYGSLAEWLTTGWGALWWSCQPCCVAFSWQWLSWHSQKHIRMQLLSHLFWIEFWVEKIPPTGSLLSFSGLSRQKIWYGDLSTGIVFTRALWWSVLLSEAFQRNTAHTMCFSLPDTHSQEEFTDSSNNGPLTEDWPLLSSMDQPVGIAAALIKLGSSYTRPLPLSNTHRWTAVTFSQ